MNRRNFLRSGSLAMVAAAGLPKALKAGNQQEPGSVTYRTKPETGKDGQWMYEISIDHSVLEDFKNAKPLDKNILLKMAYFAGSDLKTPTQQGDCYYVITKVSASTETVPEWEITIKPDKNLKSDSKLDKAFPKSPKFYVKKEQYLEIRGKDGQRFKYLEYVDPESSSTKSSDGCFLTTACVQHRQLQDDCNELQSLRYLRDHFMKNESAGCELIKQYQVTGPAIVKAINSCDNSPEIYEYMYTKMIRPSVELVQEGKYQEAVEYYKTFVKALMSHYA